MSDLLLDRQGPVVRITLDRPERHNAITGAMYDELLRVLTALSPKDTRVVVFRGAGGRAFAAGNEISEFTGDPADALAFEARARAVFTAVAALPQVTIAAVDGVCVGGGLALATHCDLRLATTRSRFGYPIARTLGNALPISALARCVAVFGESTTRQMLLASTLIDADRAYRLGALMELCDDADALTAAVDAVAAGVCRAAPLTLEVTKTQLARLTSVGSGPREPSGDGAAAADDEELLARVYSSDDFREGIRAFLAKEPPRFG